MTILDKRGVGLSDRMPDDNPPSLETRADDLLAVMEAADVADAVLLGSSEGGSLSAVFAATHPDKANGLILHNTWASAASFGGVGADATARVVRQSNWHHDPVSRHLCRSYPSHRRSRPSCISPLPALWHSLRDALEGRGHSTGL